ncbi:arrestin domain-containing protein 3-like [Protopterus annectens]|uniref:arrestin domain-containing protein 3-like n=1 Tax=Protopterus annectens TaxID=7888 RepID=UPI001CFB7225|nr:arrestin domain-containing protein 3-like [Protopterus annectens]
MERTGYVPDESLPVIVEIQNNSSRSVIPKASIFQLQSFHARGKTRTERLSLTKLKGKQVSGKTSETWRCQLHVPQYPPSIPNCTILRMEYVVTVKLKIPASAKLTLDMPLIIGSIPLKSAYSSDFLMQPISSISK